MDLRKENARLKEVVAETILENRPFVQFGTSCFRRPLLFEEIVVGVSEYFTPNNEETCLNLGVPLIPTKVESLL